jgi:hypothetical protein
MRVLVISFQDQGELSELSVEELVQYYGDSKSDYLRPSNIGTRIRL